MLSLEIKNQLIEIFKDINQSVTFVINSSEHPDQNTLSELCKEVISTCNKFELELSSQKSPLPMLRFKINELFSSIQFTGVPSGHEFSSLILAILNLCHQGKKPDDFFIQRIKNLNGPIKLRTIVSLDCENCPEVVQTLNLMATIHPSFEHTMIDGALIPEEIKKLNLMGVPAVYDGDELILSGKNDLVSILEKLESRYKGISSSNSTAPKNLGEFDVIVVGAGPAGISSAIYTSRKGLKTAILADRLGGQVLDTKGIENFISLKYTEGKNLAHHLRDHLGQYPIKIFENRRVDHIEVHTNKTIYLQTGEFLTTQSMIIATGAKWRRLNIPGETENIGKGVAYCPHCDGPFFYGKDVVVVGGGNSGVEAALDLAGMVHSVTLLEYNPNLKADKFLTDKISSVKNINVMANTEIKKIISEHSGVTGIEIKNRQNHKSEKLSISGIFVQIGLVPNSDFLRGVVAMNPNGEILIDNKCRTNIPGIYAAGDVTNTPFKQIMIALGEGAKAGLSAFEDLRIHS